MNKSCYLGAVMRWLQLGVKRMRWCKGFFPYAGSFVTAGCSHLQIPGFKAAYIADILLQRIVMLNTAGW